MWSAKKATTKRFPEKYFHLQYSLMCMLTSINDKGYIRAVIKANCERYHQEWERRIWERERPRIQRRCGKGTKDSRIWDSSFARCNELLRDSGCARGEWNGTAENELWVSSLFLLIIRLQNTIVTSLYYAMLLNVPVVLQNTWRLRMHPKSILSSLPSLRICSFPSTRAVSCVLKIVSSKNSIRNIIL